MGFENKGFVLVIVGVLVLLIAIGVFASTKLVGFAPSSKALAECKTIQYNGPEKINLLFFSTKTQAESYTEYFLNAKPFDAHKEAFNSFYIDEYDPSCELYKGIAVLCHSRELIKQAAACPHDFIIVLDERDESIRSSAYLNVMSLNTRHVFSVFLHEFGHVFANLAEEYINHQNPPRGSPNCVNTCVTFGENADGCFNGCSLTSLQRSIENGVMRTLQSSDYGLFNNQIIEKIIEEEVGPSTGTAPITGEAIESISACEEQEFILVELQDNEVTKTVHQGCVGGNGRGSNTYEVTEEGEVIDTGEFSAQIFTDIQEHGSESLSGETFEDEQESVFLTLPVQGEEITLFDEEGETIAQERLHDAGARPCPV